MLNMQNICSIHKKICKKYEKNKLSILINMHNMQKICKKYAKHIQNVCKTYARNMSNMQNKIRILCRKNAKKTQK